VLYLDRRVRAVVVTGCKSGRFGYSDLKEAALSGAADLWELNMVKLLPGGTGPEVLVCRERLIREFMAANELRSVA
jgi:hypothetical protein